MAKQELNLFQLASGLVAEAGAGSAEIVWSDHTEAAISSRFANDRPDHFRGESTTLNLVSFADCAKENSIWSPAAGCPMSRF